MGLGRFRVDKNSHFV